MTNCTKKNTGFTLIEMSIVMVIIGLIIGGILIGQELIRGAEARGIISQIDKYTAAVNVFKNKFNAVPGDYISATSYLSASATNGNGDGLINDNTTGIGTAGVSYATLSATSENQGFWNHLYLANTIEGNFTGVSTVTLGTSFPYTKANRGGIFVYGFTDYYNYYAVGLVTTGTTTVTTAGNLTPDCAMAIDIKFDDGLPTTGTVTAKGGTAIETVYSSGAIGTSNCVSTSQTPNVYNSSIGASYLCQLKIQMQN